MPVIKKGSDYMQAITYTGNGSTQTINVGFQPDLVWIKSRSAATDHKLVDSVRGATLALSSNTTGAEATDSTGITAFTSTGFTLGANSTYNTNGATYVAWCWKKGATPGFDIVTYTGDGTSSRNVSHSLGVAPSMVIVKNRSAAYGWPVKHKNLATNNNLILNTTDAAYTPSTGGYIADLSSSSVFTLTYGTNGTNVNASTNNYVAYLFAEIAGFSKFGSFVGNNSADGPFVFCGFRPKYILRKISSAAGNWTVEDTSRAPYNEAGPVLFPDTSNAENAATDIDILSNGFKIRKPDATSWSNANGATYIYAAFAETPFRYSLAR